MKREFRLVEVILNKSCTFTLLALFGAVLAAMLLSGCGDNPTGPGHAAGPKFYFSDAGYWNQLRCFDLASDTAKTIVMSQSIFGSLAGSSVLHRLYIGDATRTGVFDTDLDSLIDVKPLPSVNGIAVSPDGRMIALCGDSLIIVRSSDFSVLFHDSAQAARPIFSADSKSLYAVGGSAGQFAIIVKFTDTSIDCIKHSFPSPLWRIVPAPDETKWLLYVRLNANQYGVGEYNPEADSLGYATTTSPGLGDMEFTHDGSHIVYTSPGPWLAQGPVNLAFYVVDVDAGFTEKTISTAALIDQDGNAVAGFRPAEIALSSDDRYLAIAPPQPHAEFVIYDLKASQFKRCWNFRPTYSASVIQQIACISPIHSKGGRK